MLRVILVSWGLWRGNWGGAQEGLGVVYRSWTVLNPARWILRKVGLVVTGQCSDFCENFGTCQMAADGSRQCRCTVYFEGPRCEVNKCSRCLQGACVVNKQTGDVTCK